MPTLHLGVMDIPYAAPPSKIKKPPKRPRKRALKRPIQQQLPLGHHQTTGSVALVLEKRYHVLGTLFEKHKSEVVKSMTDEVAGQLVNLMNGGPAKPLDLIGAMSEVADMLKQGIAQRELDGYPGIPTRAAQRGISHRLLHPYLKSNPERPSFIDTSTYQGSITAWFES
jgi:hypothetical protein